MDSMKREERRKEERERRAKIYKEERGGVVVTDATTSSPILLLTTPNDTPGRRALPTLFRFQTPGKAGRTTISDSSARPIIAPIPVDLLDFVPRLCPSRECFAS